LFTEYVTRVISITSLSNCQNKIENCQKPPKLMCSGKIIDKPVQNHFKSDIIHAMSTKVKQPSNQAAASATSAARAMGCIFNL
jgi:hypothetical protein